MRVLAVDTSAQTRRGLGEALSGQSVELAWISADQLRDPLPAVDLWLLQVGPEARRAEALLRKHGTSIAIIALVESCEASLWDRLLSAGARDLLPLPVRAEHLWARLRVHGSLRRYAELFATTAEGVIAFDAEGRILFVNPIARELLGLPDQDRVPAMSSLDLVAPRDRRTALALSRQLARGRFSRNVDLTLVKNGGHIVVNGSFRPLLGEAGVIAFSFRDVTQMRAIERELRDLRGLLQAMTEASVYAVDASNLLSPNDREMLVAELAGGMAHQLNQPLTGVLGSAELLLRRIGTDGELKHTTQRMYREAQRIADIVRKIGELTGYETTSYVGTKRILDLDRASSGKGPRDGGSGQ